MKIVETKRGQVLFLLGVLILAVAVRLPLVLNANVLFNSDHAVNVLTIKHLLENGELQVYYYGIRYQGLVEPLLVAPILIAGNFTPLAWFLGATCIHLLFILIFWLCSREFCEDKRVSSWVILFLALSPFAYTYWSTDSVMGGHSAVCIWFMLLLAVAKKRWSCFSFGNDALVAGLIVVGLYHYRLFQVYLPSIFVLIFAKALQSAKRKNDGWSLKPFVHLTAIFSLAGLGLLLISKCADLTDYPSIYPGYSAMDMLQSVLLPDKFIANLPLFKELLLYVSGDTCLIVTGIVVSLSLTSFLFCRRNRFIQLLLGISVGCTLLTFYVSPDTYVDHMSVRYLLHVYPIIIMTMVSALYGISFRWKYWRWPLVGFLLILLAANGYSNFRGYASVGSWEYRPVSASPYYRLAQFLKSHGFIQCKADYWTAYATTYFSNEEVIVTSDTTVRYPPYRDQVNERAEIGYIRRTKIPGLSLEPVRFEDFFIYLVPNRLASRNDKISAADLDRPETHLLSNFFSVWDRETAGDDFQLYLAALRAAQCESLEKVITQSHEIVRYFSTSEIPPAKSESIFVMQLYQGVLGRKALESEMAYWVVFLKRKIYTRDELLAMFFYSEEFKIRAKQIVAARCYQ